jgi:hypothetical protein
MDHLRESLAFMRISPQGESKRRGEGSKETTMGFVILNPSRKNPQKSKPAEGRGDYHRW